jgi:hypothetical protein
MPFLNSADSCLFRPEPHADDRSFQCRHVVLKLEEMPRPAVTAMREANASTCLFFLKWCGCYACELRQAFAGSRSQRNSRLFELLRDCRNRSDRTAQAERVKIRATVEAALARLSKIGLGCRAARRLLFPARAHLLNAHFSRETSWLLLHGDRRCAPRGSQVTCLTESAAARK